MPQPEPGQYDRLEAGARITCLADALLTIDAPATPGTGRQSAIGAALARVAEVLVEHLVGQRRGEGRAERFKPLQQVPSFGHRRRNESGLGCVARAPAVNT